MGVNGTKTVSAVLTFMISEDSGYKQLLLVSAILQKIMTPIQLQKSGKGEDRLDFCSIVIMMYTSKLS